MKTSKKTMLIAALVVAVVALAGVGYATATTYKGTTTNEDNNVDVTYVKLGQSGAAAYTDVSFIGKSYFNTSTTQVGGSEVTTYTVIGDESNEVTIGSDSSAVTAYIISSNNLILTLTDTEGANYEITVKTAAAMATSGGLSYYFGLKDSTGHIEWSAAGTATTNPAGTSWTIAGIAASTSGIQYTVVVAVGAGSTTTDPTDIPGTFEFIATGSA